MNTTVKSLGAAVVALSMLVVAGCTSSAEPTTPGGAQPSTAIGPEAQAAQEVVDAASAPIDEFVPPGPATDGAVLEGKTVYFVPATLSVPLLNLVGQSLTGALANVGADVQICDAKANPTDAASCITQAVDAGAAAVVTAGLTPEFAPTAFDALLAAGIPWVQGFTTTEGDLDPAQVAYVTSNAVLLQSWATNWVIADSGAASNAIVVKLTDTPAVAAWADHGILGTYDSSCTECQVELIEINSGQEDKLPSLISSALVANPDITYVQAQADQLIPEIQQGIQSAARDDVRVVSVDGVLSTMQDIQSGGDVKAVVGFNQTALAWYMADAAIRLAAGDGAVTDLQFPFRRIFTEANTTELTLTDEAAASGEWFGDADYQAGFLELWGVQQ